MCTGCCLSVNLLSVNDRLHQSRKLGNVEIAYTYAPMAEPSCGHYGPAQHSSGVSILALSPPTYVLASTYTIAVITYVNLGNCS